MAKIEGMSRLMATLRARERAAGARPQVVVGFGTNYAVHVHENLEAHHPVGQAKFLEAPARTHAREIGRIVREAMRRGAGLAQALLLGGLRLQRESQLLCPVDTGALRASAFTRLVERGG